MTRIDVYTLEPDSGGDCFLLACRLTDRIQRDGLRSFIHCPDPDPARHLDRLLWTFREDRFLPHGLAERVDPELTPTLIGDARVRVPAPGEVLVNLAPELPDGFERFDRLCDLVDRDPAMLAAGRVRYKQYRALGYSPRHHSL